MKTVVLWAVGLIIAVTLLLVGVDWLVSYSQTQHARWCAERWEGSGYPTKYERHTGCKIKVDDRWILEQYYRPERS